MTTKGQALSVLLVSTLAFTVCFMVWMMFGVIGIPIKKALDLNATEFGLLTATPVLTGSLIRVPLGIWTDKFGGRVVMATLMAATIPAIWAMSYATEYWHFLVIGLFVGLAGGSFSVGTPYVARWFPRHQQGFAMGIYGAGNSGAAVNKFVAPALVGRRRGGAGVLRGGRVRQESGDPAAPGGVLALVANAAPQRDEARKQGRLP